MPFETRPGGEHDDQHAGDLEEPAHVEQVRALVDEHAEHAGDGQAEQRADEHVGAAVRGRRRDQEQGRLEALAGDGEERDHGDADRRALGDGEAGLALELLLQVPGWVRIQKIIQVSRRGGREADDRERVRAGVALEPVDREVEDEPDDAGQRQRPRDRAGPHVAGHLRAGAALHEGEDDGDDQRRLEALPQGDQEAGAHMSSVPNTRRCRASRPRASSASAGGSANSSPSICAWIVQTNW